MISRGDGRVHGMLVTLHGALDDRLTLAVGTLTVAAGKVYSAQFLPNVTSGEFQAAIAVSPSGTAGIVTVTVYNVNTVTAGTFSIISA